jgi:recombinational DNA repair protein RecR
MVSSDLDELNNLMQQVMEHPAIGTIEGRRLAVERLAGLAGLQQRADRIIAKLDQLNKTSQPAADCGGVNLSPADLKGL